MRGRVRWTPFDAATDIFRVKQYFGVALTPRVGPHGPHGRGLRRSGAPGRVSPAGVGTAPRTCRRTVSAVPVPRAGTPGGQAGGRGLQRWRRALASLIGVARALEETRTRSAAGPCAAVEPCSASSRRRPVRGRGRRARARPHRTRSVASTRRLEREENRVDAQVAEGQVADQRAAGLLDPLAADHTGESSSEVPRFTDLPAGECGEGDPDGAGAAAGLRAGRVLRLPLVRRWDRGHPSRAPRRRHGGTTAVVLAVNGFHPPGLRGEDATGWDDQSM